MLTAPDHHVTYDAHALWHRRGTFRIRDAARADAAPSEIVMAWPDPDPPPTHQRVAEIDHRLVARAGFARIDAEELAPLLAPARPGALPTIRPNAHGEILLVRELSFWPDLSPAARRELTRRMLHRTATAWGVERLWLAARTERPPAPHITWDYWLAQANHGAVDAGGLSLAISAGCRPRVILEGSALVICEWENPVRNA